MRDGVPGPAPVVFNAHQTSKARSVPSTTITPAWSASRKLRKPCFARGNSGVPCSQLGNDLKVLMDFSTSRE
jgi:hypothetical protein